MFGIKNASVRGRAVAGLAACALALCAPAPQQAAQAGGSNPVITEVIFRWSLEPLPPGREETNGLWWTIRPNVLGSDPDGGLLKRRILVLDRAGGFRGEITSSGIDPNDPSSREEPGFGWPENDAALLAEIVGGQVVMSLEDDEGNVSDPVTVPISAPQKAAGSPSIDDVELDEDGGKIVVSGVNLHGGRKVSVNKRRVRPRAISVSPDGSSLTIDLAAARLDTARAFLIRVGSGKSASNAAFLRR
jgi:hypothetical protein